MVIDFGQVLKSLDGRELIDADAGGESVPLALGRVAANALMLPAKGDKGVDKIRKYDLALKVYGCGEVEISADEAEIVKIAIAEAYVPLVCGQAAAMLS